MPQSAHPPTSTYRLQITETFTLFHAAELVGYLAQLGVGAVYVSPLLRAVRGSEHGYDVVDHGEVDPARGGAEGLRTLSQACQEAGLGLVVDIVPNHMGVVDAAQNRAWWELLGQGPGSDTATWFDVDWEFGHGRVRIPVLADDFVASRDLSIDHGELRYRDRRYPIAPGTCRSGDSPSAVHDRQHYALVSARRADTDQNYRRFFAITDLAGLRVEDPDVHDATHHEISRWLSDHAVTGIRVDHPDGLAEPGRYLDRLAASAPQTWIVVEKITAPGEGLPAAWPVAGTTGYDALAEVNGVFIDAEAEGEMDRLYRRLTGDHKPWGEHVEAGKRAVVTTILWAEVRRLARLVPAVPRAEEGLAELAVAFGVYRSYLPLGAGHLDDAVRVATGRRPDLVPTIAALRPRLGDPSDELCVRFQQLTGAVTAKGVEDTAFYRFSRCIGLNEVGGHPGTFGSSVAEFHDAQIRRAAVAPEGMTTLSTHDTKRGEDLRARLAVLTELPSEWAATAGRLLQLAPVPDPTLGYLLWQTLVGTGLIGRDRMHAFAQKAMREAAVGTGWRDPQPAFEDPVHAAVDAAYDDREVGALITEFSRRIAPYGWSNSLSQKLVQLTMPGIPDVYQGSELVEASLVDPDNRRGVDFSVRRAVLERFGSDQRGPDQWSDPDTKCWVTGQALRSRRHRSELFTTYRPLSADGPGGDHLVAFDRGGSITLATRLPVRLEAAGGWQDTTLVLPTGSYRDQLTGRLLTGSISVGETLGQYPVALLLTEGVG
jgi:(1->4)-alpha-D-glucan 1-alpha-D-glucosylmutase